MKFKVFISGNQKELQEERIAVKEVILNTSSLAEMNILSWF